MCGRFNITDDAYLQALLKTLGIDIGPLPEPRYNIAPTDRVPVIHELNGSLALNQMRWWLVPSWSDGPSQKYAMFNARSETLAKSRAFRGPFKRTRAIIPASSFIEWQKTSGGKQPYLIEQQDGALAFAGLWDLWERDGEQIYSCSIVTTDAAPSFEWLHNRMPVMLDSDGAAHWLDHDVDTEALATLFKPALLTPLVITPIDQAINNARNKDKPKTAGGSKTIR